MSLASCSAASWIARRATGSSPFSRAIAATIVLIVMPPLPTCGKEPRLNRLLTLFLDWIAKNRCQLALAWNIVAPHAHDAGTACQRPRGDLIDDAIRLCVILLDECDGTVLII